MITRPIIGRLPSGSPWALIGVVLVLPVFNLPGVNGSPDGAPTALRRASPRPR